MPIVGICTLFVISFAAFGDKHSKTIENAPAFSISNASFKSFAACFLTALLSEIFFKLSV